jgi:CBS domain-containing protein
MTSSAPSLADRLATPVRAFMRPGVITVPEDASLLEAKRAMVRHGVPARAIEPDATAKDALTALARPGTSHLLVSPLSERTPHGVVAPMDLIDLVTRP